MRTITDKFKVVSVSTKSNSFGLRGLIIVNQKGQVFEIGVNNEYAPEKDDIVDITFEVDKDGNVGKMPIYCNNSVIENSEIKPDCPPEILNNIFMD